ncbi:MAG: tetratricopeptide repeat protein [Chloroflexi bacterium]|nr:tetratricopeptide repeat protein [Chloroflexota bacterium]
MDARHCGVSASCPPQAKAVRLPVKPSPLKGLFLALPCLSAPSVSLAFWSAGGFNPRRFWRRWRWCALLFALVMVFGVAGGVRGQENKPSTLYISYNANLSQLHSLEIFQALQKELQKYAIKVETIPHQDLDRMLAYIHVELFSGSEDANPLYLEIVSSPTKNLASFLVPHLSKEAFQNTISKTTTDRLTFNYLVGISLYSMQRCDLAPTYLKAAIPDDGVYSPFGLDSRITSTNFYLGNCALTNGDLSQAANYFENAIPLYDSDLVFENEAAINLAWTYHQLGLDEDAFRVMNAYVDAFSPDYATYAVTEKVNAFAHRAQLYALVERYDDAITDLTAALELDPENPELYTLRGQMYLALYEWDKALADYNTSLELAPDYADAYYYRGVLYASILQTGLTTRDDALADFRRYLDLAPDGDHAKEAAQAIADLEAAQDALGDE